MKKMYGMIFYISGMLVFSSHALASRTCQYNSGPKAGTAEYFPLNVQIMEAPVGGICHDGFGSSGVAIPDQQGSQQQTYPQQYQQPQYQQPSYPQQYQQPQYQQPPYPQQYQQPQYQQQPYPQQYRQPQSGNNYPPNTATAVRQLGFNREGQVTSACVGKFGATQAGAACIAGTLTVDELKKCFSDGIGGRGCFGDNNTLVSMVRRNFEAASREENAAGKVIRSTTGVSIKDIEEHGILGGCNSDARKILGQGC